MSEDNSETPSHSKEIAPGDWLVVFNGYVYQSAQVSRVTKERVYYGRAGTFFFKRGRVLFHGTEREAGLVTDQLNRSKKQSNDERLLASARHAERQEKILAKATGEQA